MSKQNKVAQRRPTIKDVAKIAGVSWMTVSRVVNAPQDVSAATLSAVLKAIDTLGYVPNKAAASLQQESSKLVALILPDLTSTIFHDMYRGLNAALEEAGYLVLIGESHYQIEREAVLAKSMAAWHPAGFVFPNILRDSRTESTLGQAGIPVCLVSDPDFASEHMVVGYSSLKIGAAIARYLIRMGKRRVAYVRASRPYTRNSERMLEGARSAAQEFEGCEVSTIGVPKTSPLSFDDGAAIVRSLGRPGAMPCDALVFVNDVPAAGAVFECLRSGIRIPEQLAIVGFGDSDLAAQITPALTTIRVDADVMGRTAAALLLARMQDPGSQYQTQEIGFRLIARDTA